MKSAQKFLGLFLLLVASFAPSIAHPLTTFDSSGFWRTQARADLQLKTTPKAFSANGGAGSAAYLVSNTTSSTVNGSVAVHTDQAWITIVSGGGDYAVAAGKKLVGTVKFAVAKNESAAGREGVISIADAPFTVTQAGAPCKLAISPAAVSVDKDGTEAGPLEITATLGCGWSVTADSPWITIPAQSASGTGTGSPQTIVYAVGKNDVMKPRTGKVYVQTTAAKPQKKTHTVKQPAQTMGTLPGLYAGVDGGTMVQLVVSDKGAVTGFVKNNGGGVWSVAGTLSPLGSLTATGTLKKGTGSAIAIDGSEDEDGDLFVTAHWTENGAPASGTMTLSKKLASAVPARYTLSGSEGSGASAGVLDIAADATVSGLVVNPWSETYSFSGVLLRSGRLVGIITLDSKVTARDPNDSGVGVMTAPYSEGSVLGLSLTGSQGSRLLYFLKTTNGLVGVYAGSFSGTYPGGKFSGSFKVGVNADGSAGGYAISPGDEESAMLRGAANLTTGELQLWDYKYDFVADDWSSTPVGQFVGTIQSNGQVSGTATGTGDVQATFSGSRVTPVPQLPLYAAGSKFVQYRANPFATGANFNTFAGYLTLTKNGEPVVEADLSSVRLLDPSGAPVTPVTTSFIPQEYMLYACSADPCVPLGPIAENGYYATYASLAEGTYTYEVTTADGHTLTSSLAFPGQVMLPSVGGAGMTATWSAGNLSLRWTNPTSDPAWPTVNRVQVQAYDSASTMILSISNSADATQVTVPAEVIAQAKALGNGTLGWWRVETRANEGAGMNYARAYSPSRGIPAAP